MSEPETDDSKIQSLLQSIREKTLQGEYIYRGEPEQYKKISSTLYRMYEENIEVEYFDIQIAQHEMLEDVKAYTDFTDQTDVLTELQHYGGKTNLIDFTKDYLIALFFACDGSPKKDGRVILLNKKTNEGKITSPKKNQNNRVISQKSIFVQAPKGYLDKKDPAVAIISIPKKMKQPILDYLRTYHGIATPTIYNDIFGYIQNQKKHQSAYAEFYIGLTSYKKGEYKEAIEHYDQSININPQSANAYNNRGNAKRALGRQEEAIADYNEAIRINPQSASAYNNRGNATCALGLHYRDAIADYDQAIRIDPQSAEAHNNRGNAKRALGRNEEAIADFDEAIRINPQYAEAYNNRGNVKKALGHLRDAIADYDQAISMDSHDAVAYYNRGIVKVALGQPHDAITNYDQAILINPHFAEAYCNRGNIYKASGEPEKARADLQRARELATKQGNQELAQLARRLLDELPPPGSEN